MKISLCLLLLLPTWACAQHAAPAETATEPLWVEVQTDKVIVHPGQVEFHAYDISIPDGLFAQWLKQITTNELKAPVALVFRPGDLALQRLLSGVFDKHNVPFFKEPWEADRPLDPQLLRQSIEAAAEALPPRFTAAQGHLKQLQIQSTAVSSPTPVELPPKQEPVYIECRHGQLFAISLAKIKEACDAKMVEILTQTAGDDDAFLRQAAQTTLAVDGLQIDYTHALMGSYVLSPLPDATGAPLTNQLVAVDPEHHILHLYVRPDSLEIFRQIRELAWRKRIQIKVELLDDKTFIKIGGGNAIVWF